jgi:hypothetical protein
MYKTSSDQQHYLARTGSHSTKESRTGLIRNIPAWALPAEEYYNSLKEQFDLLIKQSEQTLAAMANLQSRLNHRLTYRETETIARQIKTYGERQQIIQQKLADHRQLLRWAGQNAFGLVFYHLAQSSLAPEQMQALEKNTQELMCRPRTEFTPARQEMSEQKRDRLREKERLGRVRKHSRIERQRKKGDAMVWSDEKQIQTEYGQFGRTQSSQRLKNIVHKILNRR